jgi:adenosylcobinamide-GDP ribazoletransferase
VVDRAGVRLALSLLTVAPVRSVVPDRRSARLAMTLAPVVGGLIGLCVGLTGIGLRAVGAHSLLAAVVVVALAALLTRGMHLDGLADTVDGLGVYGDREQALHVMRRPEVGAFGVVAIGLDLLAQAASAAVLLERARLAALVGFVVAAAAGRLAASLACRPGVPAARPDGLGALVVGTVAWPASLAGGVLLAALAVFAVPARPWQGPLAVLVGLLVAHVVLRHALRRFGGITGDVLGALVETATVACYVVLALS